MAENAEAGRSSGGKTKALLCRIDRRGGGVSGMPPVTSPRETIPDDWLADSRRQERQERPTGRPTRVASGMFSSFQAPRRSAPRRRRTGCRSNSEPWKKDAAALSLSVVLRFAPVCIRKSQGYSAIGNRSKTEKGQPGTDRKRALSCSLEMRHVTSYTRGVKTAGSERALVSEIYRCAQHLEL